MGKKSKAKKIIRELLEDKVSEKENRKNKKKEKHIETSPKFKINRKKLFGGILALIMLTILISVGYLLFQKAFRAEPIAKFLPGDSTVAILEINTNFEHNQLIKSFNLLKNHPRYSKENLIAGVEKFLEINYENDLKPWLGRQIGFSLLNSRKEKGTVYELYFAEFLSQTNINKFLKKFKAAETTYAGHKTYQINIKGGPGFLTLINNYMFVSSSEQAIYQLLDSQNSTTEKVYNLESYRKIDNNLPLNRTAFIYIDFKKIDDGFFQHFPVLSQSGLSADSISPFLKNFNAEGGTLVAMDNNFALQSFLSLDSKFAENSEYLSFKKKYVSGLSDYLSKETIAFWGGENLEHQLKKIVEVLAGGEQESLVLFDRIMENYAQKYFGKDADYQADLLPFFRKEFAFSIEKTGELNNYKLLFELEDPQKDMIRLQQLANNFASVGAVFEPSVVEHTLKDGTVGKEIIAVPEEIIKNEIIYDNITISELIIGQKKWGISYAVLDNIAVISNNSELIKKTIDLGKNPGSSLRQTKYFIESIDPILNSSDEVNYFNMEEILPVLFGDKPIPDVLNIIGSLSSGRNYFNDGIITINYLHIK